MSDEFVRKDVFEEVIKRMEALNAAGEARAAASEARMMREAGKVIAQHRRDTDITAVTLESMYKRLSDMNSRLNWFVGITGGLIGLAALAASIAQFCIAFWK